MTIVVAHLDRFGQALRRIATTARGAGLLGDRVVLHVPGAPVQCGPDGDDLVARRKTHQARVVHFGWVDHAARAQQIDRVHRLLDLCKRLVDLRTELPFDPLTTTQPIAMFAAVGTFELAYQLRCLFGNRAHLGRAFAPHVQDGPDMQRADRRMGVPGALAAVFFEDLRQRVGVFGQVLQGYGTVFDKTHRFAVTLQAHHDVEPGLSHFPKVLLRRVVRHFNHRVRQQQVTHQLAQLFEFWQQIGLARARKFNQQDGGGPADQGAAYGGRKGRILQRQINHGAVHQLHRRQRAFPNLDDVLRRIHGAIKGGKVHHPQHLCTRQLTQTQGQ